MFSLSLASGRIALFISSVVLVVLFSGCAGNKTKELALLNASNNALESSTQIIVHQNLILRQDIKDKQYDYKFSERAFFWNPKATLIETYSDSMFNYIEALKNEVSKEASVKTAYGVDSVEEGNMNAVATVFGTSDNAVKLLDTLKRYYKNVLAIDSQITYESDSKILLKKQGTMDMQQQDFQQLFNKTSAIAGLLLLNKLQNDVVSMENKLFTYVKYEFGCLDCGGYEVVRSIIAQSISYAKPGEQIEITAGIGEFIHQAHPRVRIDGIDIPVTPDGVAIYKLKASKQPGKHTVHVKVDYLKPDGTTAFVEKNIEYTVAGN